ncbi:chorismate-binding protein [Leptolyngbya sp. BL0902]|uniref:chorismate-binding protein n=1 Tax=Leptolyngbya sp. BL0902 TaxID=1115757 RepID=UPI001CEC7575|nr:chorismate-binding protein [Leptolyngbya sp. BL0902]
MTPTIPDPQPWHLRSLPLNQRTGTEIFQALYGSLLNEIPSLETVAVLLESPHPLPELAQPHQAHSRYSICAGPPRFWDGQPQLWTPDLGEILPTLAQRLQGGSSLTLVGDEADLAMQTLPFTGGWLGWLGYDLAWEIERLPSQNLDPLPFPVALWYEPDTFAVLDHTEQRLWLAATDPSDLDRLVDGVENLATQRSQDFQDSHSPQDAQDSQTFQTSQDSQNSQDANPSQRPDPQQSQASESPLTLGMTAEDYQAAVVKAKQHIQAGDVFQVNLSLRFSTQTTAPSWDLYRQLHRINPSPFACYWHTPWGDVISCSPERLIQVRGDQAQTRPIAGTRPRGSTPAEDTAYAETLLSNPKERAEHIMLVDLERNDLGRVCRWGTVRVDELLTVEYYSHVMHLVSNVVGQLLPDKTAVDLIRAAFPGGTITGCPKVRCMEIIEDLEPVRRSLFYGSCGYLDRRGYLDLNILIRTLLYGHGEGHGEGQGEAATVWGQVGAGIVADSQPDREWRESLQKAKAQLLALGITLTEDLA